MSRVFDDTRVDNTTMADNATEKKGGRLKGFFTEVNEEGHKVSWPTPEQARQNVVIVLAVTAILATFIGVVDVILSTIYTVVVR